MKTIEKLEQEIKETIEVTWEVKVITEILRDMALRSGFASSQDKLRKYLDIVLNNCIRGDMINTGLITRHDQNVYELTQKGREMYEKLRQEGEYSWIEREEKRER